MYVYIYVHKLIFEGQILFNRNHGASLFEGEKCDNTTSVLTSHIFQKIRFVFRNTETFK
jgi:hypothetical protein